jgi:hypothetical protein
VLAGFLRYLRGGFLAAIEAANSFTVAAPMPRDPPVISAALPANEIM